jgi:hypothetical protein
MAPRDSEGVMKKARFTEQQMEGWSVTGVTGSYMF